MEMQQKLELMGALHHSNHPALVVFTDLVNFAIYQPYGNAIQYFHTLATHSQVALQRHMLCGLLLGNCHVLAPRTACSHTSTIRAP